MNDREASEINNITNLFSKEFYFWNTGLSQSSQLVYIQKVIFEASFKAIFFTTNTEWTEGYVMDPESENIEDKSLKVAKAIVRHERYNAQNKVKVSLA